MLIVIRVLFLWIRVYQHYYAVCVLCVLYGRPHLRPFSDEKHMHVDKYFNDTQLELHACYLERMHQRGPVFAQKQSTGWFIGRSPRTEAHHPFIQSILWKSLVHIQSAAGSGTQGWVSYTPLSCINLYSAPWRSPLERTLASVDGGVRQGRRRPTSNISLIDRDRVPKINILCHSTWHVDEYIQQSVHLIDAAAWQYGPSTVRPVLFQAQCFVYSDGSVGVVNGEKSLTHFDGRTRTLDRVSDKLAKSWLGQWMYWDDVVIIAGANYRGR